MESNLIDINKLFKIFNKLENTSTKTAKEKILKDNESDMDFREALVFLLNPFIVTGISTKKMTKKITIKELVTEPYLFDFRSMMEYLKTNNSGRDVNIINIQSFINRQETEELKTFIRKFVTKDLKLGISEKTVNKVYGANTIPSFAVMLAEGYAKKESKVTGDFFITLKLDGNRCVAMKENGEVKFFSRKGQAIEDMVELEAQFTHIPNGFVYDGELLLVNKDNLPSDELFRATQKVVRKDGVKKNLEFHMFDILPIDEFKAGKSKNTYKKRRKQLEAVDIQIGLADVVENIHVLPVLYEGDDKNTIAVLMKWAEQNGYEGLMVNTADGLYVNKRTDSLLKVKTMKTADLLVMSVEKAIDGQFKDLLSRVNVEYKGNLVGVGSGFTLEQRKYFAENPNEISGKIIEVQFFEESKDEKTGLPSLRFPVFKSIRYDKGIEDINYGE